MVLCDEALAGESGLARDEIGPANSDGHAPAAKVLLLVGHLDVHGTIAAMTKPTWADRYCVFLVVALAGYAFAGKAFAYIGFPPLYMAELVLVSGLLAMFQTRCTFASLVSVPSLLLAALMLLTVVRTVPFVQTYGTDALRDSVLVMYGFFAFIVATLLLQRPERLISAISSLRWLTGIYVFVAPVVYVF